MAKIKVVVDLDAQGFTVETEISRDVGNTRLTDEEWGLLLHNLIQDLGNAAARRAHEAIAG